ncbi:MAG: succinate dehydrogenase cytochrome b subunit [Elainellaceae cyanobacterium]
MRNPGYNFHLGFNRRRRSFSADLSYCENMVSNQHPTPLATNALASSRTEAIPASKASGLRALTQSPLGKKLLTGITGLGLVAFVVVHLLGNLTLFFSTSAYNQLAYILETLGPITYLIELLLLAVALLHIHIGTKIYIGKRRARPVNYAEYRSAGKPSRQSLSSQTMIVSGLLLGVFLVFHVATFKFGPYYELPESAHRDLSRLVFETFHKPAYTAGYVIVMGVLGLHLRHGLWSAMQSLGVATKPSAYAASAMLGGAIALGFIGLPLSIYFGLIG